MYVKSASKDLRWWAMSQPHVPHSVPRCLHGYLNLDAQQEDHTHMKSASPCLATKVRRISEEDKEERGKKRHPRSLKACCARLLHQGISKPDGPHAQITPSKDLYLQEAKHY